VDEYQAFRDALSDTEEVLYLLDNAGEIVFDRILIETMVSHGKRVLAVVKGSPVLNDCTKADAIEAGLVEVCEIIDNGSDAVGTIIEWTPEIFKGSMRRCSSLSARGREILKQCRTLKRQ